MRTRCPHRPTLRLGPWFCVALAALLAGCGSSSPDRPGFIEERARLLAVTLPESLAAGDTVAIQVNLGTYSCPYSFETWRVLRTLPADLWIAPIVRRPTEPVVCPAYIPRPTVAALRLRVPDAGPLTVHCVGSTDTLDVELAAGVQDAFPGHRVQLVPRFAWVRVDSVAVSFFVDGTNTALASARTDAQGIANVSPPCVDAIGRWMVYAYDPASSLLLWQFDLPLEAAPCGRALRTVMSFAGPQPVPLASRSPWTTRGWRL